MTILKLQLPYGKVATLNSYRNQYHYRANKEKKNWAVVVHKALVKAGFNTKRKTPFVTTPVKIRFGFSFPDRRKRDIDGMAVYVKYTLDALVSANVLPEDNVNHVPEITLSTLKLDKNKQGFIRVSISDHK